MLYSFEIYLTNYVKNLYVMENYKVDVTENRIEIDVTKTHASLHFYFISIQFQVPTQIVLFYNNCICSLNFLKC